jgi:hypothetical protein
MMATLKLCPAALMARPRAAVVDLNQTKTTLFCHLKIASSLNYYWI